MHTLTKQVKKEIKELSERILPSFYEAPATTSVLGKDLIKEGCDTYQGKPIEANMVYSVKEGFQWLVNHRRQMEKAYELNGKQGIIDYMKDQNEIHRIKPETALQSFPYQRNFTNFSFIQ